MTTVDLRTPVQKRRDARHSAICSEYTRMLELNPSFSPYRVMSGVARQMEMTVAGIRLILMKNGLYTAKQKSNEGN